MSHTEQLQRPSSSATQRLEGRHLQQALDALRDVSLSVDGGRTWGTIERALAAPHDAAVDDRLAGLERDLLRVMSIVANPGPAATYLGDGLIFMPTAHALPLIGFADDLQITPSLLLHRLWDEPTTSLLQRVIRPGDRFLDIGANIGYFTLLGAALAGAGGHVHAFEPNPGTHDVLARNVRLNNFSHVCTLHQTALGDRPGEVTLHTFRHNQGGSTLSTLPQRLLNEWHERPTDCVVPMTTLDEVFANERESFDCIKIDAEGSEAMIWEGGRRFFREHVTPRTIVLLEWNPPALCGAGADLRGLMDTFATHGFQVWRRTDQLAVSRVMDVSQLDDWCNSELVLARDQTRIAEVFP
ncbi:MAG: FkbM family methyltransferase [Vicinamibacterales bacterium]